VIVLAAPAAALTAPSSLRPAPAMAPLAGP
jgi:hypothetical protein